MYNSRNIDDLREDVAANCRIFLKLCEEEGLPVIVTGTVRDEEYQLEAYKNGTSRAKVPSFHSVKAGLAFDIAKNVKGQEYSDKNFFYSCAKIGKRMGFEWGGDWKSIVDMPHFQWSGPNHEYTSGMIIAGNYPPQMPLYGEEQKMTQEQFDQMLKNYLDRIAAEDPAEWSAEARAWAEENGIIYGDENGWKHYKSFCTREQMAVFLKRLADYLEK